MNDVLRIARLKKCPPKGISRAGNSDIHHMKLSSAPPILKHGGGVHQFRKY